MTGRALVTLALSISCAVLAVAWPCWLTTFRAEGAYGSGFDQATVPGNLGIATTAVQTNYLTLRMGSLRAGTAPTASTITGAASADTKSPRGRLGLFGNGLGSFGEQRETANEAPYDFHTVGLTVGADYKLTENVILGAALGYLGTRADVNDGSGNLAIDNFNVSAFGTYYLGNTFYVDGIVTGGLNRYDQERNLSSGQPVRSHPDGDQIGVSVGGGYDFHVGALTAGPTARLNYLYLFIERYLERGDALVTERFNSQHAESLTTDLGVQVSYAISVPFGVLSPILRFEWEHEFLNDSRVITSRNVNDPSVITRTRTNNPDRDYFNFGAGLSATLKRGIAPFVYYEAVLGRSHFDHHSFTAGIRFELD